MNAPVGPEPRLVEYLLGGLPPEAREQIEERFFTDDDLQEELMATADDLVGAYLTGELPAADRKRLESGFLASPRGRERLALVRDLLALGERAARRGVPVTPAAARSRWPWLLAAAAVVVVAFTSLLVLRSRPIVRGPELALASPLPPVPHASPAAPAPAPASPPAVELAGREATSPRHRVVRSAATQVVQLPRNTDVPATVMLGRETRALRLEVAVDQRSPTFEAVIRAADGIEVWRADGLTPTGAGKRLAVTVPTEILGADGYTFSIETETSRGQAVPRQWRREYSLRITHVR